MKNTIFKTAAFTLMELVISSLLVGIVLLGIFSINTVLTNNNQDFGQKFLVKSQTQITLNHILNNAALAIGSSNANDEAFLWSANVGTGLGTNLDTFCMHQGPNDNIIPGNASDIWLCYEWHISTDALVPYQIQWCAEAYNGAIADPRGASSCSTSATIIAGGGPTYIGTADSTPTVGFNPSPPAGTPLEFTISIQNCLNNSSCPSADQEDNPGVTLTGGVIPLQVSSQ